MREPTVIAVRTTVVIPDSPRKRARKDGTMSEANVTDKLTQLAGMWVDAVKESAAAEIVWEDSQGQLKNKRNRVVELAEKLKEICTAQTSKGGRVTILTPGAKAGAILVEKGRVIEVEKDEIVGLATSEETAK